MIRKVKRSIGRGTAIAGAHIAKRPGDDPGHIPTGPVKSNRFLKTPQGWYIRTRESNDLGPFASEEEAFVALQVYLGNTDVSSVRRFQPTQFYGIQIHDTATCPKERCALCAEVEQWESQQS
ncbi:MAG: hypothetical protein EP339_11075 [Gammaproteobacteria bacterium]|nr:MAG: hypothetical protein EP339_11075 [Gammaproteobacteria bacterium]